MQPNKKKPVVIIATAVTDMNKSIPDQTSFISARQHQRKFYQDIKTRPPRYLIKDKAELLKFTQNQPARISSGKYLI